jgi:hypothetical protein
MEPHGGKLDLCSHDRDFEPAKRYNRGTTERTSLVRVPQKPSFLLGLWCALGDDFRTFLRDFVTNLPEIQFPPGLSL